MATSYPVDDTARCPICKDDFTDPRSLPCLHTFCLKCLKGYCFGRGPGEEVECPLCGKEFNIKDDGVKKMTVRTPTDITRIRQSDIVIIDFSELLKDKLEMLQHDSVMSCWCYDSDSSLFPTRGRKFLGVPRLLQMSMERNRLPTEVNLIPYSELKFGDDPLHSGGFSLIHRATDDKQGTVVFKELVTKIIDYNSTQGREIRNELMTLTSLQHKNIVSTIGVVFEPEHYGIVLEYAKHGALDIFIENYEVEFMVKISFVRDIVRGLNHLHGMDPPVIHGYLKTQHVLIADGFVAKICDFGLSKSHQYAYLKTRSHSRRETATHIPPENWKNIIHKRTVKYDIYSLGILLWELFTEKMWFLQAANDSNVRLAVSEGQRPPLVDIDEINDQITKEMRLEVKRLIISCWAQEADERPFAEALRDELQQLTTGKEEQIQKAKDGLETEIMTKNTSTVTIQAQQQQE